MRLALRTRHALRTRRAQRDKNACHILLSIAVHLRDRLERSRLLDRLVEARHILTWRNGRYPGCNFSSTSHTGHPPTLEARLHPLERDDVSQST